MRGWWWWRRGREGLRQMVQYLCRCAGEDGAGFAYVSTRRSAGEGIIVRASEYAPPFGPDTIGDQDIPTSTRLWHDYQLACHPSALGSGGRRGQIRRRRRRQSWG